MNRIFLSLFLLAAGMNLRAAQTEASLVPDDPSFDSLAIQHRGRIKPFLSFAREITTTLTGRTSIQLPDLGQVGARQLILSLWMEPAGWDQEPILLVEDPALRRELGLTERTRLFSLRRLMALPRLAQLAAMAESARASGLRDSIPSAAAAAQMVALRVNLLQSLLSGDAMRMIPPPAGSPAGSPWSPASGEIKSPSALAEIQSHAQLPQTKLSLEVTYLKSHPFRWAWVSWLLAALLLLAAGKDRSSRTLSLGWSFSLLGSVLLVAGFAVRIWIAGRPPVTNMYESILWVAFGASLFAIFFAARYSTPAYLLAASPVVILALVASDLQPAVLDPSLNPLVPVLRSNFWLTIHVLTITLSYGAFALATALGHFLVFRSLRHRILPSSNEAGVIQLYRCLQIGVLLLAAGVILGGVWANYSWGRFWDWDPKETWALIALLSYIILLHGRLGGWWGGYGLAVGSIACFLTILMAWYGVNFVLGKGLHSYGFGNGGQLYVGLFALVEVGWVIWALLKRPST